MTRAGAHPTLFIVFAVFQTAAVLAQTPARTSVAEEILGERAGQSATVSFFNRPIVVFRARVAGRAPDERALGAGRLLHDLLAQGVTGPVVAKPFENGAMITVASRGVLLLTAADVDDLAGETVDGVAARTVDRLRQAFAEAEEARRPGVLLRAAATAAVAIAAGWLALMLIGYVRRSAVGLLDTRARRPIASLDEVSAARIRDLQGRVVRALFTGLDLVVVYGVTTFVLRQFPYTRPWGESMSGFLLSTAETLSLSAVRALPGLFTAALILVAARFLINVAGAWFTAVEHGRVHARWIYPETAQATRRLATALVWLLAIVVAYPYMPGSQTEAFKGLSVFLGLLVTFGSSGLVNQIMSGFMITYSRSLRVGDFVRIGDVEGTVTHLGVLSTKVRSIMREEITIPNAVVVSQTTTDYSRLTESDGVFTPTSVTIGYDAPWRQVHALLLLAAQRTPGLRADPAPVVLQAALEDFYVKYTLYVSLKDQARRAIILDALHANVQDAFNEHGVQIMSPNYVLDPAAPKVVPKAEWFAAPAQREPSPAEVVYGGLTQSTNPSSPGADDLRVSRR
jgi:small-conductance mechanosensitive channel